MKQNIHIGQIIKDLLYEKKISKSELARRLGETPQAVNHKLGKASMTTDSLQAIMIATGIKAYEIFNEDLPESSTETIPKQINSDLELQFQLCKKDVERYKVQLEEKERMIQLLMKDRG
ncbi:MAG: helix-turn-helix domain-containing protein [Bacteroidia bacterium]|nr:helix-turn-helix domain-containing protein [Bacteroidia bacterium]